MSNYAEECLKKYVKIRETLQVQMRFEIYPTQILVYYYYDNEEYFNLLHLNWKTFPNVGIDNLTGVNDSEIFFNRSIKCLTRLDIKKR